MRSGPTPIQGAQESDVGKSSSNAQTCLRRDQRSVSCENRAALTDTEIEGPALNMLRDFRN